MQLVQYCIYWVAIATMYTVESKMVDLSHDHSVDTFMSTPLHPKYTTQVLFDGEIATGVFAKSQSYSIGEHGGTHVDVGRHFSKDGVTMEQMALEDTIADGVMIDCTEEVEDDPDYYLTLKKVQDWEAEHGEIPTRGAVVINFNWSHKFNDSSLYFNTDDVTDANSYRFPVLSSEAIDFLVDQRDIKILAVDTMGPDLMTSQFPVHVKMLARNKLITENIKDPGRLPPRGFRFFASPVKFVGATGVQVRAFAIVHDEAGGGGSDVRLCTTSVWLVAMVMIVKSMFSL